MKTGRSLQELAIELDRQNMAKRDLVVDTSVLKLYSDQTSNQLALSVNKGVSGGGLTEIEVLDIGDIAHRQIGAHTVIPAKYYDRMRVEAPELLSINVNHWFNNAPARRMVRTLDGRARAFLSDRYRRIDNQEIAEAVLPIIGEMLGAQIMSCELTESRMYLKVVNARIEAEVKKGDIVQAGIVISNSETGQGAVSVHPLIYRLVCTNGMIAAGEGQRKYHVGRGIEADANYEVYRDETVAADDRAFMLKLQDTVRAAMDEARFAQIISRMQEATAARITGEDIPKVVELTSKEYGLNQSENSGVLRHLIRCTAFPSFHSADGRIGGRCFLPHDGLYDSGGCCRQHQRSQCVTKCPRGNDWWQHHHFRQPAHGTLRAVAQAYGRLEYCGRVGQHGKDYVTWRVCRGFAAGRYHKTVG